MIIDFMLVGMIIIWIAGLLLIDVHSNFKHKRNKSRSGSEGK